MRYFDGGTRLNTPIKPAIALGGERILIIGLNSISIAGEQARVLGERATELYGTAATWKETADTPWGQSAEQHEAEDHHGARDERPSAADGREDRRVDPRQRLGAPCLRHLRHRRPRGGRRGRRRFPRSWR